MKGGDQDWLAFCAKTMVRLYIYVKSKTQPAVSNSHDRIKRYERGDYADFVGELAEISWMAGAEGDTRRRSSKHLVFGKI